MTPAALLLDLDGTLVDSEPRHVQAHRTFLATQGITASDELCQGNIGQGDHAFYAGLIREHGHLADPRHWVAQKTALLMQSYRISGLALRPGVHELLGLAAHAGIPCLVVTSAERALCRLTLEIAGLDRRLMARICHEDVQEHKPHPQPYLLAAARLGVPAARCLVVEDSVAGVTSGHAAGCHVVGFPGLVEARALRAAGAHRTITTLAEVLVAAVDGPPPAASSSRASQATTGA